MNRLVHSHQRARARRQRGITLLELMIVLVIVGILAAIGYPAMVGYSDRARRADGKSLLMDAAARQERYYFDNNQYAGTLAALGYGAGTINSGEGNYVLAQPAAGPTGSLTTSYALTATAQFTDTQCGNLTLDSRGTEGISTSTNADDIASCWNR